MYQIFKVDSVYNYAECVVVTTIYIHDVEHLEQVFKKRLANDKSTSEMESFTQNWSLTSLSIHTGKTPEDLVKQFGQSFKRCYVRPLSSCVDFDVPNMVTKTFFCVQVSLNADFSDSQSIHIQNESSLTEEFLESLKVLSKAGYSSVK